jgi:hypothetical protein
MVSVEGVGVRPTIEVPFDPLYAAGSALDCASLN